MGILRPPGRSIPNPSFAMDLSFALIANVSPGLSLADERAAEKIAEKTDQRSAEKTAETTAEKGEERADEEADACVMYGRHIRALLGERIHAISRQPHLSNFEPPPTDQCRNAQWDRAPYRGQIVPGRLL